jgi:hypothetical protein
VIIDEYAICRERSNNGAAKDVLLVRERLEPHALIGVEAHGTTRA